MTWLHVSSVTLSCFLASLVEFVEALTIILAVGTTRNWRSAFAGTFAALIALAVLIFTAGPSIQKVPIHWMQLVVGAAVAIFGLNWLRKATLRSAGLKALHDEDLEFSQQVSKLQSTEKLQSKNAFDIVAMITAFKAVFLEGFEVAFIVITAGSISGHFDSAVIGAVSALILVVIVGLFVHKPLSKVPENLMKKCVGIMLSAFGIFWLGEGLGVNWPGEDLFILVLILFFAVASVAISSTLSRRNQVAKAKSL